MEAPGVQNLWPDVPVAISGTYTRCEGSRRVSHHVEHLFQEIAWVIREYGEDGDPIISDRIAYAIKTRQGAGMTYEV